MDDVPEKVTATGISPEILPEEDHTTAPIP